MVGRLNLERIQDDEGVPHQELLSLFRAAFGGADSLWPANRRWLGRLGDRLVSHAAVQRRWFIVDGGYLQGWFVGTVCTAPEEQRRGHASQVMSAMHADLRDGELVVAVLNCGEGMVGFYERFGYSRIADRATYLRDGEAVVDEDPAMAIALRSGFDVGSLRCGSFPFGFDF